MNKIGFSADKYIEEQSKYILERINSGEGRLYLEFGGKLVEDKHAMRVLPGFDENAKIKLLQKMSDKAEIIICIYAGDIIKSKTRQDFGITYDLEVMRLIDEFRSYDLEVNSVVVTRYEDAPSVNQFLAKLERRGIRTYKHMFTKGYPTDVDTIVSEEGYGANPYIEVSRPLIVVTGPGGGSGKLATSLSQVYHEYKLGRKARYAKFETFPIWNLPLKHPVNIAYEAATADLKDVNMIDSFHLDAYGETAVNYNRDIDAFPVLKRILHAITGSDEGYKSPTDMGVNRAGFGIIDDEICREAAKQEIVRRYLIAECSYRKGSIDASTLERCKLLMEEVGATKYDRPSVREAEEYVEIKKAEDPERFENVVASAIQLPTGSIICGRSSHKMVATAAMVLNAIKKLAGIQDDMPIISPTILDSMANTKVSVFHDKSSLDLNEVIMALTLTKLTNPFAELALRELPNLRGCVAHCTAILSEKDEQAVKSLGIDITSNPEFSNNNLYSK